MNRSMKMSERVTIDPIEGQPGKYFWAVRMKNRAVYAQGEGDDYETSLRNATEAFTEMEEVDE